jgi:hypothetical protein
MRKAAVAVTAVFTLTGLGCASLTGTGSSDNRPSPASAPSRTGAGVTESPPLVLSTGPLSVGVALAAHAADPWENHRAVAAAHRILSKDPMLQAQSLMGWGVGNPEPSPGVYEWSGLARRLDQITSTDGTPVLTLCGAPDWMAGHRAGRTDWARLGEAPTASHYRSFARLAAAAARRFPSVHYFQVWNELKGFWNARTSTWDIAGYTRMYNDVYRAIKAVNPKDEVGGPYVVMASYARASAVKQAAISGPWGAVDPRATSALSYWLAHAAGADFVAVDGDAEPTWGAPATGAIAATAKLAAIDAWLRAHTKLPIWWSEVYVQPTGSRWAAGRQAAVLTVALTTLAASGASVALLWGPEEDGQGQILGYLWTSCDKSGGGQPTSLATSVGSFNAAVRSRRRVTLLVNPGPGRRSWTHGGRRVQLGAWQIVYEAAS